MCGIAGYFETKKSLTVTPGDGLKAMSDQIRHRGPDDAGIWFDGKEGIGLAHRRLSIIDLSPAGHQPMMSHRGRYVIAFNGEIYNHNSIRRELDEVHQITWRGTSDTETLLAAIEWWGVDKALEKCVGMFAFALWDFINKELILARDRLGEKPLYYARKNDLLLFASELKAIQAHPCFQSNINRNALALFFRHNYIPAPYTIWENVHKLMPGTYIVFDRQNNSAGKTFNYWSARKVALRGQQNLFDGTTSQASIALEERLGAAIEDQIVADVPLGAFLSGGIDSSTIVALMQSRSSRPVQTFTIGFQEEGYNEAVHAKAVAQHLGTYHTELYVSPEEAMKVIPSLPAIYDEPFADSSQIPTFLVSKLARAHVTVSLSGDGGDELFCGYNRYNLGYNLWRKMAWMPKAVRSTFAFGLNSVPDSFWRYTVGDDSLLPTRFHINRLPEKAKRLAEVLSHGTPDQLYSSLVSHTETPNHLVLGGHEPLTPILDQKSWLDVSDFEHRMMYLDMITYLPDDILVKVDRAAMRNSLETRVPMLDHRVVEFAWSLPLSYKKNDGMSKWPLRSILYRHVPKSLVERPKMGFGVPIGLWLRASLKPWAEALLNRQRVIAEGYLNADLVQKIWSDHISGRKNQQYQLWNILMFQAWLEDQRLPGKQ